MNSIEDIALALDYRDSAGFVGSDQTADSPRQAVWQDLKAKCRVDAAFFSGAIPLVAFVVADDAAGVAAAQRRLWNYGRVPLLIATTPSETHALSCSTPPTGDLDRPIAALRSANVSQSVATVLADFSRYNVESGRVMTAYPQDFDSSGRVDASLLRNLRTLRSSLVEEGASSGEAASLLGRSILIRYLEDRGILTPEHVEELGGAQSFTTTLRLGRERINSFFSHLGQRFNGDVFGSATHVDGLPVEVFEELGEFFAGSDLVSGQQSMWPYDFAVIPSELISSIYEQLLDDDQRESAAYYTPRSVVDLVLDEVLPWQRSSANPLSLLDPACGSGIFLAESFRRLVYQRGGGTFDELSRLLTTSVYGVDSNRAAVEVAAFSLYLTLLEHVDPPTIWASGRLPNLIGTNLLVSDFFAPGLFDRKEFDLIVGNPPWKSKLTTHAQDFVNEDERPVADKQIATAFLWKANTCLKNNGTVGFVLPAKSLVHNRAGPAVQFRRQLVESFNIQTIVDLSPLRQKVFKAATAPAAVAIFNKRDSDTAGTERFVYASPRHTALSHAIDALVISQENIHDVSVQAFISSTEPMKPYLWGSVGDNDLVAYLRRTFDSLATTCLRHGWSHGQGFQVGGGDRNDASELVGMPRFISGDLGPYWPVSAPRARVESNTMHRLRDPALYRGPHILIPKGFGDSPRAAFVLADGAFSDAIFGVAGPLHDQKSLKVIAAIFNSPIAKYWYFMTSSSWTVEREQVHPSEYLTLPIPDLSSADTSRIASLIDQLKRNPQDESVISTINEAVFDLFGLRADERQVVNDALTYKFAEYKHREVAFGYRSADRALQSYAKALRLNLYAAVGFEVDVRVGKPNGNYAVVECHFGKDRPKAMNLGKLLSQNSGPDTAWVGSQSTATIVAPTLIVADQETIYVLKPDQLRNWTISGSSEDSARIIEAILALPAGTTR